MNTNLQLSSELPIEVPSFTCTEFRPRGNDYCLIIPVLNEGERIHSQLEKIHGLNLPCDVILVDGSSTDGSICLDRLQEHGLRACLIKTGGGKLSAQLRVGLFYAVNEGYEGFVLMDGNNKDNPASIPAFIAALKQGYDNIQGSRFLPGGKHINTPFMRLWGIRILHAPLISIAAGFHYTDTTNGFKAFSRRLVTHPQMQLFRNVFDSYELHTYVAIRSARINLRLLEIPVERVYPKGKVPTKITKLRGTLLMLSILTLGCLHRYDPPRM